MPITPPIFQALSNKTTPEVRQALYALAQFFKAATDQGGVATMQDVNGAVTVDTGRPRPPSGVTATGFYIFIIVIWVGSGSSTTVAGYEVFRNTTDDLPTAENIGFVTGLNFIDIPPDPDPTVDYYYWVRAVSKYDLRVKSVFNDPTGTVGNTTQAPVDGHVIYDSAGNDLPQQPGLKIIGARVTDDSGDSKTIVSVGFDDNQVLHLGTENDSGIWFDGTDLWIDPALVGSGALKVGNNSDHIAFDTTGAVSLNLNAEMVQGIKLFKGNGVLTLGTTTTITDANATTTSTIILQATGAATTTLGVYVSAKNNGSFVLTHLTAAGGETFDYVIHD